MNSKTTLSNAIESLNSQDFAHAAGLCRKVVEQEPDNARAWHLCGIAEAQQQNLVEAIECFKRAVDSKPDVSNYSFNLGLAYAGIGEFQMAAGCYKDAIRKQPDSLEALNNLGTTLPKLAQFEEAITTLKTATDLHPDSAIAFYNLGNVLCDSGDTIQSVDPYRTAIALDPSFVSARENLGRALLDGQRMDEAIQVWHDWIEQSPDDCSLARHMLAAATGENVPDRCDDDSVRAVFNSEFAESFDRQLTFLDYRVPELVVQALRQLNPQPADGSILDAGCGTGLAAEGLRPNAKHLVGLDLSPEMLQKAALRNQYDELIEGELTSHMQQHPDTYDAIVCADTFCYFGDLAKAFEAAYLSLHAAGVMIFTVERRDEPDEVAGGYQLMPNGRYCHEELYVLDMLRKAGFDVQRSDHEVIRMEAMKPVNGLLVTAVREA